MPAKAPYKAKREKVRCKVRVLLEAKLLFDMSISTFP